MERQTDLSLEDLLDFLNGKKPLFAPRCLFLNELGVLMIQEKSVIAREYLEKILIDPNIMDHEKFPAVAFLCALPEKEERTKDVLRTFFLDKKNAELLEVLKDRGVSLEID